MPIFDTHAHYDSGGFNADRDAVLSALPAAGVGLVVNPGCDVPSSRAAVDLAEQYPHVYAAVGIHPEDCGGCTDADFDAIRALCRHLGIEADRVMAFGDNYNDIPMLDAVGHPYLMDSAAPELRQRYGAQCRRPEDVLETL